MRVLVLAPQPFYQERGTPIAVRLALEALSRKLRSTDHSEPSIDLLVYKEGEDINIPGVRIIRIGTPSWLHSIRPGISCKKLLCDIFFFFKAISLLWNARAHQYEVIHAVEESVFIAWFAKKVFGTPYIYDMDSSLALQITEKWWWCKPILGILQYFEGLAVRGSVAVAPVCDALQAIAHQHGSATTVMLRDVSLLPESATTSRDRPALFGAHVSEKHCVILYVGNLESYQGIDLLIDSFAEITNHSNDSHLVIVGGNAESIENYTAKAARHGCASRISFLGPRPITSLKELLNSADILVSPRVKGNNTPMKIYSYLHSGTALLATDLPTHRQVLDERIALLAEPTIKEFSRALERLIEDAELRRDLGRNAQARAQQLYTIEAFEKQLGSLYEAVARNLGGRRATATESLEGRSVEE